MEDQRINHIDIPNLEVRDNTQQKEKEKFVSILCRGENPCEKGPAVLLPAGIKFTIREIEKRGEDCVVTLKGLHRRDIRRGNVMVNSDWGVDTGREAFILLPSSKERTEKGTYHVSGGIFPSYNEGNKGDSANITFSGRVGQIRFFYPFPLVIGARYEIRKDGGKPQTTTLIYPGDLKQKERGDLVSRVLKFGGRPSLKALYSIILRIRGFVSLPPYMKDEEFEGSVTAGNTMIMSRTFDRTGNKLLKRCSAFGGLEESSLDKVLGGEPILNQIILNHIMDKGEIGRKGGFLMNLTVDSASSLSPMASGLLSKIDETPEGLNLANVSNPLFANTYKALVRMDLIRKMGGDILLGHKVYSQLRTEILTSYEVGDKLNLTSLKENSSLSRRLLIPMLEAMDEEGYFERNEEERVVLKKD